MECPYCGSIDNKVIDSRLTQERFSIRRRRLCLGCSKRFTTYESTEDRLLSVLIRKKTGIGATASTFRMMLSFLRDTLTTMSGETQKLIDKVDGLNETHTGKQSEREVKEISVAKKKAPVRKTAARKTTEITAASTVIKIVKRHKKGVGVSKLKDRTGFDDKKIRNIIYKARKQGKLKRKSRGIYIVE